jgi:antitoxin component YwqK of YwqJK toxin-antitoxin module
MKKDTEINQLDENGMPFGIWECYYQSGELLSRGEYRNGKPNGPWMSYHSDGSPRSSWAYKDGAQHGLSQFYAEHGVLVEKGRWVNNNPSGLFYSSRYNK